MRTSALIVIAAGLFVFGMLLVFEVIRPFRDLNIDGPMALGSWGVGAALAGTSIALRRTRLTFGIIALALNLLALLAAGVLVFLLSGSWRLF